MCPVEGGGEGVVVVSDIDIMDEQGAPTSAAPNATGTREILVGAAPSMAVNPCASRCANPTTHTPCDVGQSRTT